MSEILFTCVCEEPDPNDKKKTISITRSVREAEFTQELLGWMWTQQQKYKVLMGREIKTLPEFLDFFVQTLPDGTIKARGLCYVIDDVGIFWISHIDWPANAEVHYTFWDGRHKGRVNLVRKAIKYVINTYQLNRLYVRVALFAKIPLRFVETIGFVKEGRLRRSVPCFGKWWDVNVYSLLKEEVDKLWPELSSETSEKVT